MAAGGAYHARDKMKNPGVWPRNFSARGRLVWGVSLFEDYGGIAIGSNQEHCWPASKVGTIAFRPPLSGKRATWMRSAEYWNNG